MSVAIAGCGPTGMMLAGELALAGVEAVVVERRATQDLSGLRAGGLHARAIELLDQRGIADRFVAQGKTMTSTGFGLAPLDLTDFPSRHPYVLALFQSHIERLLAEWIAGLGVRVVRAREVTGFTQDDGAVTVALSEGEPLRAQYLVGCDGGRSLVRKAAGIAFPGWDATVSHLLAEVGFTQEPPWGFRHEARGMYGFAKLDDGRARVLLFEDALGATAEPTIDDLRATLTRLYGSDFGVHGHVTRFTDATRQAAAYRAGRVLLAGDAAHIHYPAGGQGLNMGLYDAVNLGWKLAQVVKGVSTAELLDTYQAERHPVTARALRLTMAQVAARRSDERSKALAETVAELFTLPEARKRFAGQISGLDHAYDLGGGHPLIGRRMPDLELDVGRVFTFLHRAQPLLLLLNGAKAALGVHTVGARYDGPWEVPVLGAVPAPAAVLVRPDGHVAWAGDPSDPKLAEAARRWFGVGVARR